MLVLAGLLLASPATADPMKLDIRATNVSRVNGHVTLTITVVEAQAFGEFTTKNVGRKMEIRVDGKLVWTGFIREPILGGKGEFGFATYGDADAAAQGLLQKGSTIEVDVVDQ
jgi:preprotein translocase subunit SecD